MNDFLNSSLATRTTIEEIEFDTSRQLSEIYTNEEWFIFTLKLNECGALKLLTIKNHNLYKLTSHQWQQLGEKIAGCINLQELNIENNELYKMSSERWIAFGQLLAQCQSLITLHVGKNNLHRLRSINLIWNSPMTGFLNALKNSQTLINVHCEDLFKRATLSQELNPLLAENKRKNHGKHLKKLFNEGKICRLTSQLPNEPYEKYLSPTELAKLQHIHKFDCSAVISTSARYATFSATIGNISTDYALHNWTKVLKFLSKCTGLLSLNLSEHHLYELDENKWTDLGNALSKCTHLSTLILRGNQLRNSADWDGFLRFLTRLSNVNFFFHLDYTHNDLSHAQISQIKKILSSPKLTLPKNMKVIASTEITFGEELWSGQFSEVCEAVWDGVKVAVKQLCGRSSQDLLKDLIRESKIHWDLNHPSIVVLYGICLEPMKYLLVMEYMSNGSLFDVLQKQFNLSWHTRLKIALDIASALLYLHGIDIIHCDLKSLNILMSGSRAKIADFGTARVELKPTSITIQEVGSPPWMAPELFFSHPTWNKKTDIYALSIILWELITNRVPYKKDLKNIFQIVQFVTAGGRETIPADTPPKYSHLVTRCWMQNPDMRPPAEEIVQEIENIIRIA